jgi:hypothetical protein
MGPCPARREPPLPTEAVDGGPVSAQGRRPRLVLDPLFCARLAGGVQARGGRGTRRREGVGSGARRRAMGVWRLLLSHLCPMSGAGGRKIWRGAAGDGLFSQQKVAPPPRAARSARRCRAPVGRCGGRSAAGDGSVAQRGGSPPPRAARGAPLCCPARGDVGPLSGAGRARRWQIRRGRWGAAGDGSVALWGVHADGSRIAFTNTCKCRRWCSG